MSRRQRHQMAPTMATHFPSLSAGTDMNPNARMFTEDVHLAVMPIGGRTERNKNFAVALEGSPDVCERARALLGELSKFDRHDLARVVCDAVSEIARHLAWEGCAVYEIISDESNITHVRGFTSRRLVRFSRWYLQIIPRGDWELWERKLVVISASKIWHLEMPTVLGGHKDYKTALEKLRKFENLGPPFWRKDLDRGEQSKNFDFQRYADNSEIYYRQATKVWGWNRRDWSQDRSTEFYSFYKMVNFRWAQAVLREHIISEINILFLRLGMDCILKVSGLPTSDEIVKVREELLSGSISFSQAADRVAI